MHLVQHICALYISWKLEAPSDGYECLKVQISKISWNFSASYFAKVNEYTLHCFRQIPCDYSKRSWLSSSHK